MAGEALVKKNLSYAEAIAYAESRKVVLPDEYYGKIAGIQRSQSISIAGLASIEQIKFVIDQVDKTLKQGGTFASFQAAVKAGDMNIDLPKHRLENIFRTNIQGAYARGRWEQQTRSAKTRPFLMYDAINDGRTRPTHHAMDGTILPRDHPFWNTHYPPNGYRCRCTVISLTAKQAEKRGLTVIPPIADPDEGWDYNPGADYMPPIGKAIDKSLTEVMVAKPHLTPKIAPVKKAIAKKAAPVTLAQVESAGKQAMNELDQGDYGTEAFFRRMEDLIAEKVVGLDTKDGRHRTQLNGQAVKRSEVAAYAKKHMTLPMKVRKAAQGLTDEQFQDSVYGRLPLPKRWLESMTKSGYYKGAVQLEHNPGRNYAHQLNQDPVLSINPLRGDVVTHEFVHLIQKSMPDVQRIAKEHFERRTAGADLKKLNTLFPNAKYAADEVTKEDKFFAAYMGRVYPGFHGGPLEVLTMSLQALLGDMTARDNHFAPLRRSMFNQDRETAEFALGLLLAYA